MTSKKKKDQGNVKGQIFLTDYVLHTYWHGNATISQDLTYYKWWYTQQ